MLKDFLWETFRNTGSIDAYVFFKEIEDRNNIVNETNKTKEEVAISG